MTDGSAIRCPRCGKLLGIFQPGGSAEVRRNGERLVLIRDGEVCCPRCGVGVVVVPPRREAELRLLR